MIPHAPALRGPDPYAIVERELARLAPQRQPDSAALCRVLHAAVPTYTWVGLVRHTSAGASVAYQSGTLQHMSVLPSACAATLAGGTTIVVHDVAATPPFRDCFPEARALISIPVAHDLTLVVASEHQGAFGLADRALLERVARHLTMG